MSESNLPVASLASSVSDAAGTHGGPPPSSAVESYKHEEDSNVLVRKVRLRSGKTVESSLSVDRDIPVERYGPAAAYDWTWLRQTPQPGGQESGAKVRVADLFSGCGAMTLGASEACRALDLQLVPVLAVDTDEEALEVYEHNFPGVDARLADLGDLLDGELGTELTEVEQGLRKEVGEIDLVVAGPPCQGYSDLNNHTRRADPKNALYAKVARAAEVFRPSHLIVENVPGVRHDQEKVLQTTEDFLRSVREAGKYFVDTDVLRSDSFGVAQERHRLFLVASKERSVNIKNLTKPFCVEPRDFEWACSDLAATATEGYGFHGNSTPSDATKRRIRYLFDEGVYDLPDEERPPCHRDQKHSYRAVYGRMRKDEAAPTITTGFTVMGQGRFVHPSERRTITPHEAARLQFIPDYFDFGKRNRTVYKKLIGNVVPPKLTYILTLQLLR